jgi:hypothetical protein
MVDYSAALPQQQNFQAPDPMQNAMRMQQLQMHGAQMQELARQRSEEEALRGITADPNSPEYIQQVARISPKLGMQALTQQRQAAMFNRQGELAGLQAQHTQQQMQSGEQQRVLTLVQHFNDLLPGVEASADPAAAYAKWRTAMTAATGKEPNAPAEYPGSKAVQGLMDKASEFLTRNKPQLTEVGGAKVEYTPNGGLRELNVTPSMAGSAGASVGPATAAMAPDRLVDMQSRQARLGLPVMQPSAAGANAAVNNMPGVPTAPAVAAPVNNMPGVPVPDAGVKNAMRAEPLGIQSPYGAPISVGEFARQQTLQANAQDLQKQRDLEVMKRDVAAAAPPAAMNATQERTMLNTVSKDRSSAETTVSTMNDVIKAVKDVQDLSEGQKGSITGLASKLPNFNAEARTAQTKFNNLKGIVTQMGKRAASLGGALGNMAVQEWKIVSDGIASLDTTNMNPKDLNDQLDIIAAKANAAAARTKDAYERQYEDLNTKYKGRFALSGNAEAAPATNAPAGERPPLSSFGGR